MRVRALSLAKREKMQDAIRLAIDGLEIARSQGALAWELKLALALVDIDDGDRARDRLREVVNRTSEGFGTRDCRDAVARLGQ
jgi:hypothetical protein